MSRKLTESCSVDGCNRAFYAKGLCYSHYERVRLHGKTEGLVGQNKIDLFFEKMFSSPSTDECILWPFSIGSKGYGVYEDSLAHRYVCKRVYGASPAGKPFVAHSCNIRLCVNQRHLRWASNSENENDKRDAGTFYERWKKVSDEDVVLIRSLYGKVKSRSLATRFKTSRSNIWIIGTCKSRLNPSLF